MFDSNGDLNQTSARKLSRTNQHCIHALIAAYFNLMSKLNGITAFSNHVDEVRSRHDQLCFDSFVFIQIVRLREARAAYLLPHNAFSASLSETASNRVPKECLFSQETVVHALNASGHDTSRFEREFRPEPGSLFVVLSSTRREIRVITIVAA
jgi:hypothetical protein